MELLVVGNDEHNIRGRLEYILHETQFKVNECRLKVRSFSSLEDANEQIEKKGQRLSSCWILFLEFGAKKNIRKFLEL